MSLGSDRVWTHVDLADQDEALYISNFLLRYLAVFSIVSARKRRWFWGTMPSTRLIAALAPDALVGTALTYVDLPVPMPFPWQWTLTLPATPWPLVWSTTTL